MNYQTIIQNDHYDAENNINTSPQSSIFTNNKKSFIFLCLVTCCITFLCDVIIIVIFATLEIFDMLKMDQATRVMMIIIMVVTTMLICCCSICFVLYNKHFKT